MSSDTPISVLPFAAASYVTLVNINPAEVLTASVQLSVGGSRFPRLVVVPSYLDYSPLSLGVVDPTDTIDFAMAWYRALDVNDVIVAATVTASPTGPSIGSVVVSGSTVGWTITGGTLGQTYRATVNITTAAGLVMHRGAQWDCETQ